MSPNHVDYLAADGVAHVTINRPEVLNAIAPRTCDELAAAFTRADADGQVRVAVLKGEGRAFCSGFDFKDYVAAGRPDIGPLIDRHFGAVVTVMRGIRKPIVGAVNGLAVGGGCGLAFACDIIVAARSAFFVEPFVQHGIATDMGNSYFLPRAVGRMRAMAMCLLHERIDAETAERWGLAYKTVDDDQLDAAVAGVAAKLAGLPHDAVTAVRRLIAVSFERSLEEQLQSERDYQAKLSVSAAFDASVARFGKTKT